MDLKMAELQDLQELAEKTKPAAHILETVMGELEQRNLELSSLLKASEKSRLEMETILKEQNEEITTMRANTLIMHTLENEVTTLTEKKTELLENINQLEADIADCKSQEQTFEHRFQDMEREKEQTEQEHSSRVMELTTKLTFAHEQLTEKDNVIEKTELTIKDLFEKCSQLGTSNSDMKNELLHCLDSGKQLKDLNTKLQFCKDYLEQQVDQLIRELKSTRATNEQLKLEMSNMSREKQNSSKQVMLLEQECNQTSGELNILKDKVSSLQKQLQEYESGEIKSVCAMQDIAKEKEYHEATRLALDKKIRELDNQVKLQVDELKNSEFHGRKLKAELMQLQSKVEYYQENFIEKQELHKIKSDLEIKYKLDLNTQLQKVSAVFEQEQIDLISAMKLSLNQRQESEAYDKDTSVFRRSYRTYN